MARKPDRPSWWNWDLELSPHLFKRMIDRRFSEADLRGMIQDVERVEPDRMSGRWLVHTTLDDRPWHVIVEPDPESRLLIVITAYAVDLA